MTTDDFPLRWAATGRFGRGAPRSVHPVGEHGVLFVRSIDGRDPRGDLWWLDLASGTETMLVAVADLAADDTDLPAAERARRERLREGGAGITAYTCHPDGTVAMFALGGRLYAVDLPSATGPAGSAGPPVGAVRELPVPGPVVAPVLGAAGVAWHAGGRLWGADLDGSRVRALTPDDGAQWGLADFIAAEELDRMRGFWWSPDGTALLVARVDESDVARWWISDPAQPQTPPREHRYPAAGTVNATVSLWLVPFLGGGDAREVLRVGPGAAGADHPAGPPDGLDYEYLAQVSWRGGDALVQLLSRDQRDCSVVTVDAAGATRVVATWTDDCWVDVVAGTPRWLADGRLLTLRRDRGADRLRVFADEEPISPADLQVRSVLGEAADGIIVRAATTPATSDLLLINADGVEPLLVGGWHNGSLHGHILVTTGAHRPIDSRPAVTWGTAVHQVDATGTLTSAIAITSRAESPDLTPAPVFGSVGHVQIAVLLPRDGGEGPLPVLMLPYGGPHAQKVMAAGPAFIEAQWWADRGYAVVVADGRGTPGVSPSWERAVAGDLATPALADQVQALDEAARLFPSRLDLTRVGIMGWSFGGYLSALAVLRRPDRFHAAVAGAPVTEWRLYDTAYTERYLGHPNAAPDAYRGSSLLPLAGELSRPLLLIHGLADDNVVAAHTLRLSSALLAAGRSHAVLPLSEVTHMTPQPVVAANLMRAQADFLDAQLRPAQESTRVRRID